MSNILAQRWLLSRRHFLRGAGTCVALPLLDAMTPLRAAATLSKPRRSVFVYIPNGVNGMTWQVTKGGRDFDLSPALASCRRIATISPSSAGCFIPMAWARRTSAPTPGSLPRRSMPKVRGNITTRFPAIS